MVAVAPARSERPDVILMDIVLPGAHRVGTIRAGAHGDLLKTVDAKDLIKASKPGYRGDSLIDPICAARVLSDFLLATPAAFGPRH